MKTVFGYISAPYSPIYANFGMEMSLEWDVKLYYTIPVLTAQREKITFVLIHASFLTIT